MRFCGTYCSMYQDNIVSRNKIIYCFPSAAVFCMKAGWLKAKKITVLSLTFFLSWCGIAITAQLHISIPCSHISPTSSLPPFTSSGCLFGLSLCSSHYYIYSHLSTWIVSLRSLCYLPPPDLYMVDVVVFGLHECVQYWYKNENNYQSMEKERIPIIGSMKCIWASYIQKKTLRSVKYEKQK